MVKNVLMLTIDSLRFDHFPLHHDDSTITTTFSTLLSEGTSFTNAFSTGPGTTCSFPALLTGTLPLSYGGLGPLTTDRPRVAEMMQEIGLTTGGFQSNPFLSQHFNYHIGFNQFEDYQNPLMGLATELFPRGIEINNPKLVKLDKRLNLTGLLKKTYQTISGKSRPYVGAEVITDDVLNWLGDTDDPFFCWAHYMDVHQPCFPPIDIRQQFGLEDVTTNQISDWYSTALSDSAEMTVEEQERFKEMYDASIVYVDQQIRRIINHLKSTNRWKDTVIVLTSDHGELFGEYGLYGKPVRMYDELIKIPLLIVNGPSYLGDVNSNLLSLMDVPPLLHDALGEDIPAEYDGQSSKPSSKGCRDYVIAEHHIEDEAVIAARSKQQLYEYNKPKDEHGFYRVGPRTFEPISSEEGDEQLRRIVFERLEEIDVTTKLPELNADVEDRLSDLGYL